MRALVASPESVDKIALQEVSEPTPTSNQAIVAVQAISLNRGEVNRLMTAPAGWRPGWDIAGVVIQAAEDGSGPKVDTRVIGFTPGNGWAERVAVGFMCAVEPGIPSDGALCAGQRAQHRE